MIVDGSAMKIPFDMLKNKENPEETEPTASKGTRDPFDIINSMSLDSLKMLTLGVLIEYADVNGVSEKGIISSLQEAVSQDDWEYTRLIIKGVNVILRAKRKE